MESAAAQPTERPRSRVRRAVVASLAAALMSLGLVVAPSATPSAEAASRCGVHSYSYKMTTLYSANHHFKVTNCSNYYRRWSVVFHWAWDTQCLWYRPWETKSLWHTTGYSSGPAGVRYC